MNKSKTFWLVTALVFLIIMLAAVVSFTYKEPLKAVDSSPATSQNEVVESNDKDKININTASVKELKSVKGIDETKAQAIVDYRKEHGCFISVEELLNVDGIGTKTYVKIKDKICV